MYQLTTRPFPRALDPLPGESIHGFVLRLSYRLNVSPLRIAHRSGLSNRRDKIPADYLLALPTDTAEAFAQAVRLSSSETHDLTLRRFTSTYPPLAKVRLDARRNTTTAQNHWALNYASRYCPQCLRGDGSPIHNALGGPWQLRWHLPIIFACSVHRRMLEGVCPTCGELISTLTNRTTSLITRPGAEGHHPLQCRTAGPGDHRNPRHRKFCGTRLDQVEVANNATDIPVGDLDRMLTLQERVERLLALEKPATAQPWEGNSHYFPDLIAAAQLIKLSWPVGSALAASDAMATLIDSHAEPIVAALKDKRSGTSGPHARRLPGLWSAPDNSAQCGALLLAAQDLLRRGDESPSALRDQVQPLVRAAFKRAPQSVSRAFRKSDFSRSMTLALVRKDRGFHAAGGRESARLRIPSGKCRFSADEVPAFLPQEWFDRYFAGFTDRIPAVNSFTTHHLRRAVPLKLVEMTAGGSWAQCADALGIPFTIAGNTLFKLRDQIDRDDLWGEFERTVDRIAHHLDSDPARVNYARRRRAMSNWQMPPADWSTLCSDILRLGRMRGRNDPSLATVVVWAQVTQSEYRHCPVLATETPDDGRSPTRLSNEIAQFFGRPGRQGSRLILRSRLDQYAADLAAQCDSGTAPRPCRGGA